jgi:chromosome segregation ATPase
MANSGNTSGRPQYIAITRMDQKVMSRMILVDFAALDMQNATIAAKEMKDFIAMLAGLPPSQVKNQIAQLNALVTTKATTIAEIRERNSALMKEGRHLVKNKTNSDKELALTQQRVKDLEERMPACTHRDLQTNITELKQQLTSSMSTDLEEIRQELEEVQEQLKIMGEE